MITIERHAADGVHRVEHAYVNWYLVEAGDDLVVVDTGHPRSWPGLAELLGALRRRAEDVTAVVLTHGHFDHVGFAARAARELGVLVHAPAGCLDVVARPWRYPHERSRVLHALTHPQFLRVFAAMGRAGALGVEGVPDAVPYAAGDDLPGGLRPVPTPGHTPGHCALHLPDRGVLLSGDALVTVDPYTLREGPRLVSGAATADRALAWRSLEALEATGADVVLPGHGPVWRDGVGAAVRLAQAAGAAA